MAAAEKIPKKNVGRPLALHPDAKTKRTMLKCGEFGCTQIETAAFHGVSEPTLLAFWKRHPEMREVWDQGKAKGRVSIRRASFHLAAKSAQMNIYLRQQLLGERPIPQGIFGPGPGGSFPVFDPTKLGELSDLELEALTKLFGRLAVEEAEQPKQIEGEVIPRGTWDDEGESK